MKNDRVALSLRAARHFSVGRKLAVGEYTPRAKLFGAGIYALSKLLLLATTLAYGLSVVRRGFFPG